jgi:hypothetical protein
MHSSRVHQPRREKKAEISLIAHSRSMCILILERIFKMILLWTQKKANKRLPMMKMKMMNIKTMSLKSYPMFQTLIKTIRGH